MRDNKTNKSPGSTIVILEIKNYIWGPINPYEQLYS